MSEQTNHSSGVPQGDPLLATELCILPAPSNLGSRPCLDERLDEGPRLGRKLTLTPALAGFGKTLLVLTAYHRRDEFEIADIYPWRLLHALAITIPETTAKLARRTDPSHYFARYR